MQNNRLMLVIAIVAGVAATGMAFAYLRSVTSAIEQKDIEPQAAILVTQTDLPANHVINPDTDLKVERIPANTFSTWARSAVKPDEREAVRGRRISAVIAAGQPLLYSHLVPVTDLNFQPGKRAMTINVSGTAGVGGMLIPGDLVDIVVSKRIPEPPPVPVTGTGEASVSAAITQAMLQSRSAGEWEAKVVLSGVRVLAVGDKLAWSRQQLAIGADATKEKPGGLVTLELALEDCLTLIEQSANGANPITLLLRPQVSAESDETASPLGTLEEVPTN